MKEKNSTGKAFSFLFTIIKYIFPAVLACLAYGTTGNPTVLLFAVSDLWIIMALTDLLMRKSRHFYWLNSILILFLNIELGVLYFSGSIVTLTMLQNLNSARALEGHAVLYLGTCAAVLVFSFLPVEGLTFQKVKSDVLFLCAAVLFQAALIGFTGENDSTWRSLYTIYEQQRDLQRLSEARSRQRKERKKESGESKASGSILLRLTPSPSPTPTATPAPTVTPRPTATPTPTPEVIKDREFYNSTVSDYYSKPDELSDTPNIIVIFTEGLSQNIVEDEREIMPNIADLQENSINFENYFNHTFATYRALQGQLYSGYQLEDSDPNYLTSLQQIVKDNGYYTAFLNSEPKNETFTEYLNGMGFDDVLSVPFMDIESGSIQSDESSYRLLLDTAEYLSEEDQPYFLALYTIGTHASMDSPDKKFGDGSSNVLNRFYNADYQFGEFFEEFKESGLSEDTVLVFTADHATYAEADFIAAFPDYTRSCSDLDEIPLSIYYEGVEPVSIDVDGRNSLDLTPTILDLIDISGSNYFLGKSLFRTKSEELSCDTIFFDPTFWKNTDGGAISDLTEEQRTEILEKVEKYFALADTE